MGTTTAFDPALQTRLLWGNSVYNVARLGISALNRQKAGEVGLRLEVYRLHATQMGRT